MRALLDTHALLWFVADHPSLGRAARELMIRDDSELLLSIGSCWELAIKHSLGKLELRRPFEEFLPSALAKNAIELLPITLSHLSAVVQLPFHHRDPFDRLLVAQAQVEKIPLVSADGAIDAYGVVRIW